MEPVPSFQSMGLTEAALTRTSTCPAPGVGRSRVASTGEGVEA